MDKKAFTFILLEGGWFSVHLQFDVEFLIFPKTGKIQPLLKPGKTQKGLLHGLLLVNIGDDLKAAGL